MTGPVDWQAITFVAALMLAAYLGGIGTSAWVWGIVDRLEKMIRGKADKSDLDRLRDRLDKD